MATVSARPLLLIVATRCGFVVPEGGTRPPVGWAKAVAFHVGVSDTRIHAAWKLGVRAETLARWERKVGLGAK